MFIYLRFGIIFLTLIAMLSATSPAHALFSDITVVDEAEMGREFDKQVKKMLPLADDPVLVDYVTRIVQRVYDTMPPQPFRIQTTVIRNGSLNAFAVPGGYVYVFTGLLAQLENEDQLAAVIAHELAHISQRHVVDRIEKMEKVSLLSMVGTLAGVFLGATGSGSSSREAGQALMAGSQAVASSAFLNYTQENEREADHVGINYLVAAGYNPEGMPQTFDTMLRNQFVGKSTNIPNYLRTHPKLSERSDYLRQRIKTMMPDITTRPFSENDFLRVRALVRGRMSDPVWAKATIENSDTRSCYDLMALGMVEARLKHTASATSAVEESLVCGGNDALVLREAGRYYFKAGSFDKATKYLQKSLFMNPDDIVTLYFNARLLGEQGQYGSAISYMKKVLEQLDSDWEVYYHLGRYEGASGDHFHGHLYLAYASHLQGNMEKYSFHKDKAGALAESKAQQDDLKQLKEWAKER